MTREEHIAALENYRDGILSGGISVPYDDLMIALDASITALRGPVPDPITGLVPCGCGGKVDVAFYPGWAGTPDLYQVDCFGCHVGTRPCQTAEQAKAAWNHAMGMLEVEG